MAWSDPTLSTAALWLKSIDKRTVLVQDIDIVENTLLLDVKPHVPRFDIWIADKTGWLDKQVGKVKKLSMIENLQDESCAQ